VILVWGGDFRDGRLTVSGTRGNRLIRNLDCRTMGSFRWGRAPYCVGAMVYY